MPKAAAVVLAFAVVLFGCPKNDVRDAGSGGGGVAMGGGFAGGGGLPSDGGGTGGGGGSMGGGGGGGDGGMYMGPVLPKPSRSSSIAITSDDALVAAVNPDNDSVSLFNAAAAAKVNSVAFSSGARPVSVAIGPDDDTAYVVLRKAQLLAKVTGLSGATPRVAGTVATGSEPTGVALSPSGQLAMVANFGEDTVSIVDTATMQASKVAVGSNPRAVAITNDGDKNDSDEIALVTLFFGVAHGSNSEATDDGREGKVIPVPLATRTPLSPVVLQPISDTGFGVGCAPNQLYAIAIDGLKAYVSEVCASPRGPVNPLTNVFAAVSVIDLTAGIEDSTATGTVALSKLVAQSDAGTSNLLGVPVALDFASPGVLYVASQAGDVVQRVEYDGGVALGAQIDLHGASIKAPLGVVTAITAPRAYVNNWVDRSVSVVDLSSRSVMSVIPSESKPDAGTPEALALQGEGFFFTGTGRWSTRSVSSCGSCHPDGLSDGLTWIFPAGPRQTVPLDGTFSKSDPSDQRLLDWTANFDEVHDFELNTRGVSGGKGAIVDGADNPIDLSVALRPDGGSPPGAQDFLAGSARQVTLLMSSNPAQEALDAFVKTIRSNRAPTGLSASAVASGRALFLTGGCDHCHSGAKWTVSQRGYVPSPEKNGTRALATGCGADGGSPCAATGLRTQDLSGGAVNVLDVKKVQLEVGVTLEDGGVGNVGPERVTCAIRNVGSFAPTDLLERKADGSMAQGAHGFNPPSLLSLGTTAPYMHAGAAATLDDVLDFNRFSAHLTAGNSAFGLTVAQSDQLKAFLLSIDETTAPLAVPAGQDICQNY